MEGPPLIKDGVHDGGPDDDGVVHDAESQAINGEADVPRADQTVSQLEKMDDPRHDQVASHIENLDGPRPDQSVSLNDKLDTALTECSGPLSIGVGQKRLYSHLPDADDDDEAPSKADNKLLTSLRPAVRKSRFD